MNLAPLGRLKTFRYTAILATGICLAGGDFSDPVGAAPGGPARPRCGRWAGAGGCRLRSWNVST